MRRISRRLQLCNFLSKRSESDSSDILLTLNLFREQLAVLRVWGQAHMPRWRKLVFHPIKDEGGLVHGLVFFVLRLGVNPRFVSLENLDPDKEETKSLTTPATSRGDYTAASVSYHPREPP